MRIWLGLACAYALFALPCLAAPLEQLEGDNVTAHEDGKPHNDLILAVVSGFFLVRLSPLPP